MKNRNLVISLPIILLILNIMDIITTYVGSTYCGLIELNPIYGVPIILFKIIFPLVLILLSFKIPAKFPLLFFIIFTLSISLIIGYAVINNLVLICI